MKLQLPSWLRRDKLNLPSWATVRKDSPRVAAGKASIVIDIDTPGYIDEWFKLLGVKEIDQYWLEVAYQCAKLDVQSALAGTEFDPRVSGKNAEFSTSRADEYALVKHPTGRGVTAATQGREAREHYIRVRGRLPM